MLSIIHYLAYLYITKGDIIPPPVDTANIIGRTTGALVGGMTNTQPNNPNNLWHIVPLIIAIILGLYILYKHSKD